MKENILSFVEKIKSDRKQRRRILLLFFALAMAVTGGVFWRMRLIGITKTAEPMCGMSDHVHTDDCIVTKILICGYDDATVPDDPIANQPSQGNSGNQYICDYNIHKHTADCVGPDGSYICGYADYVIHKHDARCYDSMGNLICTLPEIEEHIHDDSCYEERVVYHCDSAPSSETPLHAHDDSCYTAERTLVCDLPEDENHTHGDECYTETKVLTCGLSDQPTQHIHDDSCPYTIERVLICGKDEIIFHIHNEDCYDENSNLICGILEIDEHQHDEFCLYSNGSVGSILLGEGLDGNTIINSTAAVASKGQLICNYLAHDHSPSCYGMDGSLICGMSNVILHAHDANCYDDNGILVCTLPEVTSHVHTPECYTETQRWSCGMEEGETEIVHVHDERCYDADGQLICTLPETQSHVHNEFCVLQTESVLICGQQDLIAHVHVPECYDDFGALICNQPVVFAHQHDQNCWISSEPQKPKHVHTDACYEIVYGCGLEEHYHNIMCYADINADVETADTWKATLPTEVSEYREENVVNVARSQLGYTESKRNFTLDDDGTRRGYSRYGEWYGNPYGNWNSMFAAFCLHYGGIDREEIPYNSGAYAWVAQLKEKELFTVPEEQYEAIPGDIVFYDKDGNGYADWVGIVSDVTETGYTTIEGDYCDGSVAEPYIDESIIQSVINANHGDDIVHLGNETYPAMNGDAFDYNYNYDYDYGYGYDDGYGYGDFGTQLLGSVDEAEEYNSDGDVLLDEPKASYVWNDENIPTHYVAQVMHYYSETDMLGYLRLAEEIGDEAEDESDLLNSFGQVYVPYDGDYTDLDNSEKYAIVNVDGEGNKNALTIADDTILTGTGGVTTIDQTVEVNNATKWQLEKAWRDDLYLITDGGIGENGQKRYLGYDPATHDIRFSVGGYENDAVFRPNFQCISVSGDNVVFQVSNGDGTYLSLDANNHFVCSTTPSTIKLERVDGTALQISDVNSLPTSDEDSKIDLYISVNGNYLTSNYSKGTPSSEITTLESITIGSQSLNSVNNVSDCQWNLAKVSWDYKDNDMYNIKATLNGVTYVLSRNNSGTLTSGPLTLIPESESKDGDATQFVCRTIDGNSDAVVFVAWGVDWIGFEEKNLWLKINSDGTFTLLPKAQASQFKFVNISNGSYYSNLDTKNLPTEPVMLDIGNSQVLNHIPNYSTTNIPGTQSYFASTQSTIITTKKLENPDKYTKWKFTSTKPQENSTDAELRKNIAYFVSNDDLKINLSLDGNGNNGKVLLSNNDSNLAIDKVDGGYVIHQYGWGKNYLVIDSDNKSFVDNSYIQSEAISQGNKAIVNFYNSNGDLVELITNADGKLQLPDGEYIIVINENVAVTLGSTGDILKDSPFGKKRLEDNDLWTFRNIRQEMIDKNESQEQIDKFDALDYRVNSAVSGKVLQPYDADVSLDTYPASIHTWNTKSAFVQYTWGDVDGMLIMSKDGNAYDSPYYLIRNEDGSYSWKKFSLAGNDPSMLTPDEKKDIAEAGGFFQLYYQRTEEDVERVDHIYSVATTGSGSPARNQNTPYDIILKKGDKITLALINGNLGEGDYSSVDDSNITVYKFDDGGTLNTDTAYSAGVTSNGIVDCGYNNKTDKGGFPFAYQYYYRLDALEAGKVQLQIKTLDDKAPVYVNVTVLPENVSDKEYYDSLKDTCDGKYYDNNAENKKSKRYLHLDVEVEAEFEINVYRPDGSVHKVKPDEGSIKVTDVYATVYNTASLLGTGAEWNEDYIYGRNSELSVVRDYLIQTYQNPMGSDSKPETDVYNFAKGAAWLKDDKGNYLYNSAYMRPYIEGEDDSSQLIPAVDTYGNVINCVLNIDKIYADYEFEGVQKVVYKNEYLFPDNDKEVLSYNVYYNPGKIQENGQYEFLTNGWGWLELYDGDTAVLHATIEYKYNGVTYYATQDVTRLICDTTNICPSGYSADIPIQGFDIDVFMNDTEQFESTEFVKVDQYGDRVTGAQFTFYRKANNDYTGGKELPIEVSDNSNGVFHFTSDDVVKAYETNAITQQELGEILDTNIPDEYRGLFTDKEFGSKKYANAPLTMHQLYKYLGEYFVIRETKVPDGYRRVGDQINMHFIGDTNDFASENLFIVCDNPEECGVHTDPNAFISTKSDNGELPTLYYAIDNPSNDNRGDSFVPVTKTPNGDGTFTYSPKGTLYAVVAKRDGVAERADDLTKMQFDYWTPVYGNAYQGFIYMKPDDGQKNTAKVKEMIQMQQRGEIPAGQGVYKFEIDEIMQNGALTVSAKNFPGDITTYTSYTIKTKLKQATTELEKQQARDEIEYTILYYYTPDDNLNNLKRVAGFIGVDDYQFNVGWSATINIPNIENRLLFRKVDTDGHAINDAEFALYHAGSPDTDELNTVKQLMSSTPGYTDIFTKAYYCQDGSNPQYHCYLGDITNFNSKTYHAEGHCIIYDTHTGTATAGSFGIDYTFWDATHKDSGYIVKTGIGGIYIYDYKNPAYPGSAKLVIHPAQKSDDTRRSYVGYTHAGGSTAELQNNDSECSVVAENGTGHFGKIKNGEYILREIKPPAGFTVNNKAQTLVKVTDEGVFANGGEVGDGVSVMNGVGYLVSTLQSHASRGTINETLRWIYSALRIKNTDTFNGFGDASVTTWDYAKPSNDTYTFPSGGQIRRLSWAQNPEGSGSSSGNTAAVDEVVVFDKPEGMQLIKVNDKGATVNYDSWDPFVIAGNSYNSFTPIQTSVAIDSIRNLFKKDGYKLTIIYSADDSTNPPAVAINNIYGGYPADVPVFTVKMTREPLGDGKYQATVDLSKVLSDYVTNDHAQVSSITSADSINSLSVQINASNFKLYSAKFTKYGSAAEQTFMQKVQEETTSTIEKGVASSLIQGDNVSYYTVGYDVMINGATLTRNAEVVLPPNYNSSKPYPVMYLLHGFTDTPTYMRNQFQTDKLLTNMMNNGEAEEMILVYVDVFCKASANDSPNDWTADGVTVQAYNRVVDELKTYLMPKIAQEYNIKTGRENTAIFGFSFGGRQALAAGITHSDLIGYVGAAAPAPGLVPGVEKPGTDEQKEHPGQFPDERYLQFKHANPYLLMIGQGENDDRVNPFPENYHNAFDGNGVENVYFVVKDAGHDQDITTATLYNFAKNVFKAPVEQPAAPTISTPADNSSVVTSNLTDALVTYLEYQPLVISADYNLWQEGRFDYVAPQMLKGRAARSLFNYETNLHLNKSDFEKFVAQHPELAESDYPALHFKNGTSFNYVGINGNSWQHTFKEDTDLHGDEKRYNKPDQQLSNSGSRTLRLTTDYGWSSLSVYQDYAWATAYYLAQDGKQLTEYTSYVDANGTPKELTQLYSNSTFVQVVDEISTYLTIIKRGDVDGDNKITTADDFLEGVQFVRYQIQNEHGEEVRQYYCLDESGNLYWKTYEPNERNAAGTLYPEAYRFTTRNDGDAKGYLNMSFSKEGKYYLEEVSAPKPYGLVGTLEITVHLPTAQDPQGSITVKGPNGTEFNAKKFHSWDVEDQETKTKLQPYYQKSTGNSEATRWYVEILDPKNVRLELEKISAEGNTPLEGAEFIVYKSYADGSIQYYESMGLDGTIKMTDNVNEAHKFVTKYEEETFNVGGKYITYYVTDYSIERQIYMDKSDPNKFYKLTRKDDGTYTETEYKPNASESIHHSRAYIQIDGLVGATETYYIEEVKPPMGYYPLSGLIEVKCNDKSAPTVTVEGSNTAVTPITDGGNTVGYKFQVQNHAGYELPETGGIGTHYYTFGGLLLIVIPLVYGFVRRRRYGKEVRE